MGRPLFADLIPEGRAAIDKVGGYVQQILLGCVIIGAIFLDRVRATRG